MVMSNLPYSSKREQLQAELAAAACRVASHNGRNGAFIDVEMDLWDVLRVRLAQTGPAVIAANRAECGANR
jgi:hypothetical protein